MAAACNIIRNDKNEILWAEAPNGSRSELFDSIATKEGSTQEALPIWLVSKTKKFKDEVVSPKLNEYRSVLLNKINGLEVKQQYLETTDAKGVKLDLKALDYTRQTGAPVAGKSLTTITAYASPVGGGKAVNLGRLRYQIKGDTIVVDSITLANIERYDKGAIKSIKGLGLGGKLHAELFKYALQNDLKVVSSDNNSPAGIALWNKLTKLGLATKNGETYSVNMFPPGFDSNGEVGIAPLIDFIDRESSNNNYLETEAGKQELAKELDNLYKLPAAPKSTKDKQGRYTSGKVHLYHSTNGLANLQNIRTKGIDFNEQKAVKGLFFSKLGSPYRQNDSFVVVEVPVAEIDWSERFDGQEVSLGQLNDYKIVHTSELTPEDAKVIDLFKRVLAKDGIAMVKKTLNNYTRGGTKNDRVGDRVEEVIEALERGNARVGLSAKEEADVKNLMIGLPVNSSEELTYKLKRGFMPKGYFAPTREALQGTQMYSSEEITDILSNLELQANIRDYIYKLEDMTSTILNDTYADPAYLTVKEGTKNSIGKFNKNNPYVVQKEIIKKLGGIGLRSEFEERMMEDDLTAGTVAHVYTDRLETKDDLFNTFNKYKPVAAVTIEDGVLVPKTSETRELMEQTLTDASSEKLERSLDFLINLEDSMWREAPKEVTALLQEAKKNMIDMGIDATDLIKVARTKNIEETKDFLRAARNAAIDLNEGTFDALVSEYNEYFEVEESFKYEKIRLADNITNDNTFYLKTDLNGIDTFLQAGLIPVGKNVYKRVATQSSDQLVDAIINMSFASNGYETIVPLEAFKPAGYDADGRVNMAKMQDRDNALALRNSLVNWVEGQVKELYGENLNNVEVEELKKYVLYFNYYNKDMNYSKFEAKPAMAEDYTLIADPVTNTEYLSTDFIADFNKKIIKEKQDNSEAYQNYYSNFKIDKTGISLVNDDPISKSQMAPYVAEDKNLANYFRINKSVDSLINDRIEDPIVDELYRRNYYSNYPTALKPFKGEYSKLTRNTLVVKSKAPFIRTFDGVFELVQGIGRVSLYGRVTTNQGQYKRYNNNMTPPVIDANTESLMGIDTNVPDVTTVTNLYNAAEQKRIDDKYDNCK